MLQNLLCSENGTTLTHIWGAGCNMRCKYCLNEEAKNLNHFKDINFDIANVLSKIKFGDDDVIHVEHGGELLYCNYVDELLQYKIDNIDNYKGFLFTNGTKFDKFKMLFDKFNSNLEFFLSYHPEFMSARQEKDFFKSLSYMQSNYSYSNIAIVYHTGVNLNDFKRAMKKLIQYNVKIKCWIDYHIYDMHEKSQILELIKCNKCMRFLDEHFKPRLMMTNDIDTSFCKIVSNTLTKIAIDRKRLSLEIYNGVVNVFDGIDNNIVELNKLKDTIIKLLARNTRANVLR